jgi:hypothetical protein
MKPQKKAPALTPEEQAAYLVEVKKRQEDAKAERERVELYAKSLPNLSHRQLVGEFKRLIRREYTGKPPAPQAGLTIALGAILLTVLENTQTKENPFAKLAAYPR